MKFVSVRHWRFCRGAWSVLRTADWPCLRHRTNNESPVLFAVATFGIRAGVGTGSLSAPVRASEAFPVQHLTREDFR